MNIKKLNGSDHDTYTVAELIEKMLITAEDKTFINLHSEGVNGPDGMSRGWPNLRYRKLAPGEKLTLEITA